MRSKVLIFAAALIFLPICLRAQEGASIGGKGLAPAVNAAMPLQNDDIFDDMVSPEQTISMDLQDANLRDILKIFSIQSGLNLLPQRQ